MSDAPSGSGDNPHGKDQRAKADELADSSWKKNQPESEPVDPEGPRGAERGDAPASDEVNQVAHVEGVGPVGRERAVETRRGMFGNRGSGDTSGYGRLVRVVSAPGAASRPYGGWFDEVVDKIIELVPGSILEVVVHRGELTLYADPAKLTELARVLRDDPALRFEHCASVSGVHYPADTGSELHAVYHFQSMTHNRRLRIEAACADEHPHLPSIVATYPAADWHERETWDMFGIIFDGHPSLTRLLMPDDWQGHPQRKDYPLGGIPVEYKGATVPPPDQRRSYS